MSDGIAILASTAWRVNPRPPIIDSARGLAIHHSAMFASSGHRLLSAAAHLEDVGSVGQPDPEGPAHTAGHSFRGRRSTMTRRSRSEVSSDKTENIAQPLVPSA